MERYVPLFRLVKLYLTHLHIRYIRTSLIAIYKTAYYSFYMPIALAMIMCHIPHSKDASKDPYKTALSILLPLGEYFQAQDDYLDYSAPPHILGKIGTDIIDNKCSWCINVALAEASPAQRKILEENYGKKGDGTDSSAQGGGECERRVKEVFEQVGLDKKWEAYESGMYEKLKGMIDNLEEVGKEESEGGNGVVRKEVYLKFLEKIHGRKK